MFFTTVSIPNDCNIYPLISQYNRGVSNNVRLVRFKSTTPTLRQVAAAVESHLLLMIVMWVFYRSRNIKRTPLGIFNRRNAQNGLTVTTGMLQARTEFRQTSAIMHAVESAVMPIVVMHVKDSQEKFARMQQIRRATEIVHAR